MEEKNEPRAWRAVRRTEHHDGGKGWQDTIAGACYKDARRPTKKVFDIVSWLVYRVFEDYIDMFSEL